MLTGNLILPFLLHFHVDPLLLQKGIQLQQRRSENQNHYFMQYIFSGNSGFQVNAGTGTEQSIFDLKHLGSMRYCDVKMLRCLERTFSHPEQGRIDFNTVNPSLPTGMDFLIHP